MQYYAYASCFACVMIGYVIGKVIMLDHWVCWAAVPGISNHNLLIIVPFICCLAFLCSKLGTDIIAVSLVTLQTLPQRAPFVCNDPVCTAGCMYYCSDPVCTAGCMYYCSDPVCRAGCMYHCSDPVCTAGCMYHCNDPVCTAGCMYSDPVCTAGCMYHCNDPMCTAGCSIPLTAYQDRWIDL